MKTKMSDTLAWLILHRVATNYSLLVNEYFERYHYSYNVPCFQHNNIRRSNKCILN